MVSDIDPRVGQITGDAGRLQQVVWNLLERDQVYAPVRARRIADGEL